MKRFSALRDGHGYSAYFANGIRPEVLQAVIRGVPRQYDSASANFRLAAGPAWALEELLTRCDREGIPAVLVHMPEGTAFAALYGAGVRAGTDAFFAAIGRRHGVPLIDARNWVHDGGFWDTHHLLPAGARQFSDRLAREVLPRLIPFRESFGRD